MSGLGVFDRLLQGNFRCGLDYEFWPSDESSSKKLLLLLHDAGDSPVDTHFFPASLGLESLNVLFLRAPEAMGKGFSWYGAAGAKRLSVERSRALIFGVLDALLANGVLPRDVFLCGIFEGCFVCLDVALRYPIILGAVVGVSGGVLFEEDFPSALSSVACQQRLWISHGFHDEVLPFERAQAAVERLRGLGLTIEWSPLDKAHSIGESDEMALIYGFLSTQIDAN